MLRTLQPAISRAVALVNLGDRSAASLAAVLEACGEHDVVLTDEEAEALGAVLDQLQKLFATSDRDVAAARLNDLLVANAGAPRLVRHRSWDWHLHVDRADDAPWAQWLASSAAVALANRLVADDAVPWGVCAADGCTNAYVHDGRGGARRWCSTRCASRERVRRHRARSGRDRSERGGPDGLPGEISGRRRPNR